MQVSCEISMGFGSWLSHSGFPVWLKTPLSDVAPWLPWFPQPTLHPVPPPLKDEATGCPLTQGPLTLSEPKRMNSAPWVTSVQLLKDTSIFLSFISSTLEFSDVFSNSSAYFSGFSASSQNYFLNLVSWNNSVSIIILPKRNMIIPMLYFPIFLLTILWWNE